MPPKKKPALPAGLSLAGKCVFISASVLSSGALDWETIEHAGAIFATEESKNVCNVNYTSTGEESHADIFGKSELPSLSLQ